jgi:hypothetical protein
MSSNDALDNVGLEGLVPNDMTEFILSGSGATLRKEGNVFFLVEGAAYFLQVTSP